MDLTDKEKRHIRKLCIQSYNAVDQYQKSLIFSDTPENIKEGLDAFFTEEKHINQAIINQLFPATKTTEHHG